MAVAKMSYRQMLGRMWFLGGSATVLCWCFFLAPLILKAVNLAYYEQQYDKAGVALGFAALLFLALPRSPTCWLSTTAHARPTITTRPGSPKPKTRRGPPGRADHVQVP